MKTMEQKGAVVYIGETGHILDVTNIGRTDEEGDDRPPYTGIVRMPNGDTRRVYTSMGGGHWWTE